MYGYIHSTESFGSVDGPGVRFVIFMAGCPMRCLYCHNPDTWNINVGEKTEASELVEKAMRYKAYWKDGGGITVSGGEPLMQMEFVTELFTIAKKQGINTCLDTSGVTFSRDKLKEFDALMEVCDLVMLDIKHIDSAEHKKLTGHENENILDFLDYLSEKNVDVWIRHVIVPGITLNDEYLAKLGQHIGKYKNIKLVDTLPYHSMARHKYEELGIEYPLGDTPEATREEAQRAKDIILESMKK